MSEWSDQQAATRPKLLVNLGSGPKGQSWLPAMFAEWRQFRVDLDPKGLLINNRIGVGVVCRCGIPRVTWSL